MSCPIYKLGELAGQWSLLRDGLDIHQWVVSNCTVHHLLLLGFILHTFSPSLSLSFFLFIFFLIDSKISYILTHLFFLILLPSGGKGRLSEWLRGVKLPAGIKPQETLILQTQKASAKSWNTCRKLPGSSCVQEIRQLKSGRNRLCTAADTREHWALRARSPQATVGARVNHFWELYHDFVAEATPFVMG